LISANPAGGPGRRHPPRVEVDADELLHVVPRHEVVGGDGVARAHVVPVVARDLGLEREHAVGLRRALLDACETEHRATYSRKAMRVLSKFSRR
jgi:hypothetical protein